MEGAVGFLWYLDGRSYPVRPLQDGRRLCAITIKAVAPPRLSSCVVPRCKADRMSVGKRMAFRAGSSGPWPRHHVPLQDLGIGCMRLWFSQKLSPGTHRTRTQEPSFTLKVAWLPVSLPII